MRWLVLLLSTVSLTACMSIPASAPRQETRLWQRLDGQRSAGNPVLEQQYMESRNECLSGRPDANQDDPVFMRCMGGKGYKFAEPPR